MEENKIDAKEENLNLENSPKDAKKAPRSKKEKTSLILFIIGTVLMVVGLLLTVQWAQFVYDYIRDVENQLGAALGLIITFAYFAIPSFILAVASVVLNTLAFKFAEKQKILKLILMIAAIFALLVNIIFFIIFVSF